jgi:hypothetical protein
MISLQSWHGYIRIQRRFLGVSQLETVRVDICYRPLRIGWAIKAGDLDAFRTAARISFSLWGGRFNPIIVIDQEDRAQNLIDNFRVDVILPIGNSDDVKSFPKKFPHIIKPFHHEHVFVGDGEGGARCEVLDIYNGLVYLQERPEWRAAKEGELRIYKWAADDPLADFFLMQFGQYPSTDEVPIDYRRYLQNASGAKEVAIESGSKFPSDFFDHPSISYVSRINVDRHHDIRGGWETPGFFYGDVSNFEDLICFWNLRAADISLLFLDVRHLERYGETVGAWANFMQELVSRRRHEFDRLVAVWVREESLDKDTQKAMAEVTKPFGGQVTEVCRFAGSEGETLTFVPL